jgi:predicted permease
VSPRLIRLLLRFAPSTFRARYGEELLTVHEARIAERPRGPGLWWLVTREVVGMVWVLARARRGTGRIGERNSRGGGASMLDTTRQDLRFAARTLWRNPGFAVAAVVVLSLGIGAVSAIFTAMNAFLFRPLPFADADRLVMLYETNPEFGWQDAQTAPANALDWREQVEAFEDIAQYSDFLDEVTHIQDGEPTLLSVSTVSGNFFDVLGVRPVVGRGFRWEETWDGADDKVVLSHGLWLSMFGGDPAVVGSLVDMAGTTVEIVGVAPQGFSFPSDEVQLWTPFGWAPENREALWFRRAHFTRAVGRLAPGVDPATADAELQTVVGRLQQDFPATNQVMGAGFMPLRDFLVKEVRPPLRLLLGAVVLLLLLACTNVANLMLVRASDRSREVALRFALGARRRRVAGQMLVESLMLALVGGALGLGLAWVGIRGMSGLTDLGIDGATDVALDHRVLLFTLVAAASSGFLFGTVPALWASRGDVGQSLKDGSRSGTSGRGGLRTVRLLVTAEVALALLLVVAAGHMVRTFDSLRKVDPGFRTEGALAVQITVPPARYPERDQVLAFWNQFEEALQGRPGIQRAGLVGRLPLAGSSWSSQFQAEGWPPDRVGFEILHRRADRGYFEALEIPLVRGRLFEGTDGPDDPLVVVINETFASEHFPGEDPLGQKIAYDRAPDESSIWYEIVGIVGDQAQTTPREPARAEVFENRDQDWGRTAWIVVRGALGFEATLSTVRATLREMDPLIPVAESRSLREVWRQSMASEEFILTLLGVFGTVALLLASVGIYGVTAQAARRHTREIGIRMALGARSGDILRLMMAQNVVVVGAGLGVGLVAAWVSMRALSSFLFGIAPNDPPTLAAVVILLGGVALVAGYVPARRATAVDPVESIRVE